MTAALSTCSMKNTAATPSVFEENINVFGATVRTFGVKGHVFYTLN
ncbi:MAG: hypothetical protein LBP85_04700 [Prevotellaceae bacterium]|jgi:hypothetical protein|nr:hypothetical protein [Prevotellaceae bacterium]